jgi:hypothetical protein
VSDQQQKHKNQDSKDKLKNALKTGSKRSSPAAAFFEPDIDDKQNKSVTKKRNSKTEEGNVSSKQNSKEIKENGLTETKTEEGKEKPKQSNIDEKGLDKLNYETTTREKNEEQEPNLKMLQKQGESEQETTTSFWGLIEESKKKKTIEDTHTRQTYLVRNDLIARLQKTAKNQDKGFKTKAINYALEQFLDDIESK